MGDIVCAVGIAPLSISKVESPHHRDLSISLEVIASSAAMTHTANAPAKCVCVCLWVRACMRTCVRACMHAYMCVRE